MLMPERLGDVQEEGKIADYAVLRMDLTPSGSMRWKLISAWYGFATAKLY